MAPRVLVPIMYHGKVFSTFLINRSGNQPFLIGGHVLKYLFSMDTHSFLPILKSAFGVCPDEENKSENVFKFEGL